MDEEFNKEAPACTLQNSAEALISLQLSDFKTNFLEAVEELRMRRETESQYEEQISKFVVEVQELEWQKVALQHHKEVLNKQHTEAMTAFKKQFQLRLFAAEEEKGKCLLAMESKEREMEGLKETLKMLQISKYSLQKKLNEMEQKLQLHVLAKEDHQKSLNEVEKCHTVITSQLRKIKDAHARLEQNVVEAIQLNKKLRAVNARQKSEIDNVKEELKKVTADLIRSNVTCQHRVGDENLNLTAKEWELKELQQKYSMEREFNIRLTEENAQLKEEKQEIVASLQHMQQLLCRQTEANARMSLNELEEACQTLERDNELQREKAKENEEKFFNLQNEYGKTQATWKNEVAETGYENQLHTSQTENKYTQKSKEVSNNLEQRDIGLKTTRSLNLDEIKAKQSNTDINTGEEESISVEDLDCLENIMNEDNAVCHFNKNRKEASPSKVICTAHFITPELTCGSGVAGCGGTAAEGKEDRKEFDKIQTRIEVNSSNSCYSLVEEPKMLLESTAALDCSTPDTDHCTKLNEHLERNVRNEFIFEINENINNAPHEGASSTNKALAEESKVQDIATGEEITNGLSKTETSSILSQKVENNYTNLHNVCFDRYDDICKETPSQSFSSTTSNILLCKESNTNPEEIHSDNACEHNKCCEQSSTCSTQEKIPPSPASSNDNLGVNTLITTDGNMNHLPLIMNFNLNAENSSKYINDIPSRQSDKDDSILTEVTEETPESTNESLSLHPENGCESQIEDLKVNKFAEDEQKEFHTSKTTCEQSFVVCEKQGIQIKEREEPSSGPDTREMVVKGSTEDSCSLSIKTREDLVNRSGWPPFDSATMDKKAEKTSADSNLPRVCEGEIQTVCNSTSEKVPSLKEKLLSQEVKNQSSWEVEQTMNMNAAVREDTLVSTHSNGIADTLNTGSINPGPKRNPSEEWNAIVKTFYDPSFPTEHVATECPLGQQKTSQPLSEVSAAILKQSSQNTEEKDWKSQNVFIKTRIDNIERFLHLKSFGHPRKRKHEEDTEKTLTADKAEA
uniref:coiled-coil domain-containing protein 73 isoform X2 n=1 Tax=Podarcis muralis TaxID=64176 RepID=UPI0010A03648|nr:coiled-coil domain-containing protein 73 isoform X2 [Podarcis muralis]XP_028585928.1 coiled-coil domain-containing protein 73 isoform X2 [Podarcis muralis]XP_028585937.1 coiled-coil domain-containing protein 73 isoform X2 [Podarcis muralis]XP_028585947.1 coiled-coil domain-containing protein 73 isoform X2 [Podarcis muralis]XP_028585953.1 coiled-coil domain-containing protein 73 isoform X2 [Podarcis muralis]XP_028585962.1 coiled-coil domain-containing protein 73 isoform X2 [Podarcis muralis]